MDQNACRKSLKAWSSAAKYSIRTVLICSLAGTAAWIAVAWAVGTLAGGGAAGEKPWIAGVIGLAAIIARAAFLWMGERAADKAGRQMVDAARRDLLERIASHGSGVLAGESAGARAAQIQDRTAKLAGYAARWLPGMRLAILAPVLVLIAAATQSWLVGVLLLLSVAVLPVFIWLTATGTAAKARAQQASLDALSGAFQARAAQTGVIRAFRGVGRETRALSESSEDLRRRTMGILTRAFLSTAVLEFFSSISIALVAVYIGFKLLGVFPFPTGETITLKEGMMALVLAPEFFAPIRRLSTLHHDRADGVAAGDLLGPWLAATADRQVHRLPATERPQPVTFDTATIAQNGTIILKDLSFEAPPGAITVLSGPSGSGKTTCLLALLGQAQIESGTIKFGGQVLRSGDSLADSAAYLRQTPWITEGSVAENLRLAAPGAGYDELKTALRAVGADEFLDLEGGGLDKPLARFGTGLSGGQRQRLALARALLREAPLFLLDEPTAHLDEDAEERFLALVRDLARDRVVLIASHRPAVIRAADRHIRLEASEQEGAANA